MPLNKRVHFLTVYFETPHPVDDQLTPPIFITKWIDYTNKYGLGYQLRDGSSGVYFNDATIIVLAPDQK
jgi:hypothetical protein